MADINIGIDFGTSFTKVCVRNTGIDESRVFVFESTSKPKLQNALLPTQIRILNNGTILAGLTDTEWKKYDEELNQSIPIDFIKMRLADLDLSSEEQGDRFKVFEPLPKFEKQNLNSPEKIENLAIYYLSRVIKRVSDREKAEGNEISSINVCVPVQYQDSKAVQRFKRVLQYALQLSQESQASFTYTEIQEYLSNLRNNTSNSPNHIKTVPELIAAVYAASQRRTEGAYILFDIGSGTVEAASFRSKGDSDSDTIDCLSASIFPIGVASLAHRVARNTGMPFTEARNELETQSQELISSIKEYSRKNKRPLTEKDVKNKETVANIDYLTRGDIQQKLKSKDAKIASLILGQRAIHQQTGAITYSVKRKAPDQLKKDLIIILSGGGKDIEYYEETIFDTHETFQQDRAGIIGYVKDTRGLTVPDDLNMNGLKNSDFHRFTIAYGLSISEQEFPKYNLPKSFAEIKRPEYIEPPLMDDW